MHTTLAPVRRDAELELGVDLELSDDELEAVVGGLARIHFPAPVQPDAAAT